LAKAGGDGDGRAAHQVGLALAAGISIAALVRKGAFFAPDNLLLPGMLVVLAALFHARAGVTERDRAVIRAVVAFAAWWAIAAFGWGEVDLARPLLGSVLAFGAVFSLGRAMPAAWRGIVQVWLVGAGAVFALVGLIGLALRHEPLAMQAQDLWRLAGTATYANAAGLLLAAVLAVALDRRSDAPDWWNAAIVLLLCGLLATVSRGAVLGVVLGLAMLGPARIRASGRALVLGGGAGVVWVARAGITDTQVPLLLATLGLASVAAAMTTTPEMRGAARAGRRRLRRPILIIGSAAAIVLALVVGSGLSTTMARRVSADGVIERREEWRAALGQLADHPILGIGPETAVETAGEIPIGRFVHNEYLQVAADAGLVGLALLGALLLAIRRVTRRHLGAGASAALAILAVGGFLDFSWHLPVVGALAGWLTTLNTREETDDGLSIEAEHLARGNGWRAVGGHASVPA
jgi:O-antigen ligase